MLECAVFVINKVQNHSRVFALIWEVLSKLSKSVVKISFSDQRNRITEYSTCVETRSKTIFVKRLSKWYLYLSDQRNSCWPNSEAGSKLISILRSFDSNFKQLINWYASMILHCWVWYMIILLLGLQCIVDAKNSSRFCSCI